MSERYHIEELIVRYLQHTISEDEMSELHIWMQESPENKAFFFQLKNIYDSTRHHKITDEKGMEISWQRMRSKMQDTHSSVKTTSKRAKVLWRMTGYVAVILIALAIGWGIGLKNVKDSPDVHVADTTYNQVHVKKGGKPNTVILSDGSKIQLNAATTIKYPTNFSTDKREIYLDGEAYFEITENKEKPFVINLKQQSITVLGTHFNVEAHQSESYSIVTLLSGSISLETFSHEGKSISQMLLKPNQRAYYDDISGSVSLENVDASLSNVWIRGAYKFKDEPLYLITKRLENYYGIKIRLMNDSLKYVKYTGTFSLEQSIQEVLKIMNYDKQFKFKQTGNEIQITDR